MNEIVCTCDVREPKRESVIGRGFSYAIYVDVWKDETKFDPACPYHGENGAMIAKVKLA